jgi:hypothetical protein
MSICASACAPNRSRNPAMPAGRNSHLRGDGIDELSLQRALELEDHESFTPAVLKPSVVHALILAWSGDLDTSYERLQAIQRRCIEKGEEGERIFIDFHVVLNRIWRGDFAEAARVTDDATELARQLGGNFPVMLSLVIRAWLAVFGGQQDAGRAVADANDASKRSGTWWHEDWSLTALGFLETSLGNYEAAVNALEPLLSRYGPSPNPTEIFAARGEQHGQPILEPAPHRYSPSLSVPSGEGRKRLKVAPFGDHYLTAMDRGAPCRRQTTTCRIPLWR